MKIYLGRFDSPKMGRFGISLGTFWFWDVLTGYPVDKVWVGSTEKFL